MKRIISLAALMVLLSAPAFAQLAFDLQRPSDGVSLGTIDNTGNLVLQSSVTAGYFVGDGAGLTNISAGQDLLVTTNTWSASQGYGAAPGSFRLLVQEDAAGDLTRIYNTGTGGGLDIITTSADAADFIISARGNDGATQTLSVMSDGDVGIGTAAPAFKLHTQASDTTELVRMYNTGSGGVLDLISFSAAADVPIIITRGNDGATTALVVNGDGNVAIGTTTPQGFSWGDPGLQIYGSLPSISFVDSDVGKHWEIGGINGDFLIRDHDTGAQAITFEDNGHINIGNPGSAPTISSCGTSPVLEAESSDTSGRVVTGTGSPTTCVVTFGTAYTVKPRCQGSFEGVNQSMRIDPTTTNVTFTFAAANSTPLTWFCLAN